MSDMAFKMFGPLLIPKAKQFDQHNCMSPEIQENFEAHLQTLREKIRQMMLGNEELVPTQKIRVDASDEMSFGLVLHMTTNVQEW